MSTTEATAADAADSTTDERTDFIQGLRALADFIEQTPDAPVPVYGATINVPVDGREALVAFARVCGKADKDFAGAWAILRKTFGGINYDVYASREQVCERVQVGTETVTEEVPDPEKVAEIPTVTVTREEPVFEWRCDEPLLAPARDEVAR